MRYPFYREDDYSCIPFWPCTSLSSSVCLFLSASIHSTAIFRLSYMPNEVHFCFFFSCDISLLVFMLQHQQIGCLLCHVARVFCTFIIMLISPFSSAYIIYSGMELRLHLSVPSHCSVHLPWHTHLHVLRAQLQLVHGKRQIASVFSGWRLPCRTLWFLP